MPKLFWCDNCHWFHHRISSFNIMRHKGDICKVCKNKLRVFEVPHTNWMTIGFPITILIGIIFWIWSLYEIYLHNPSYPSYPPLIVILFMGFCALLIILGFGLGLSIFDDHAMADKILNDHPKLIEKQTLQKHKKLPNQCDQCKKELPNGAMKCPFCGYEYN